MKLFQTLAVLALSSTPAFAASEAFFTLQNTHFVATLAFVLLAAIIIYLKVPGMVTGALDSRRADIQAELDEARALREEAQSILAEYERKQKEVATISDQIVATAKSEAKAAARQADEDLKRSIARRLQAAEDQIAGAKASAVKEIRDTAIAVSVAAARQVIAKNMTAKDSNALIDAAIKDVGNKLH